MSGKIAWGAVTWAGLCDEAAEYANGLDRASLGRFVVSFDDFVTVVASHHVDLLEVEQRDSIDFKNRDARRAALHEVKNQATALSELFWWQRIAGGEEWAYREEYVDEWTADIFSQWESVVAHPEMHDYFAVDIWDTALIARCIAEDIDPAMARVLL